MKRGAKAGSLWRSPETPPLLDPRPAAGCPRVVVRETLCRSILNQSSISDYSLNCYTGCTNGCVYCYARFMQRFHPHAEPWGAFVDVKVNAVETLRRQLRRARPGDVFMSSACDGWQPIEAERRLTRGCCELLLESGFAVNVLTKSELVMRDFDLFAGRNARVGVTITTLDDRLSRLWEPGASSPSRRDAASSRRRGAPDSGPASCSPPCCPSSPTHQNRWRRCSSAPRTSAVDEIWVDALNPRPKVWDSVCETVAAQNSPDLREPYRRILFDAQREGSLPGRSAQPRHRRGRSGSPSRTGSALLLIPTSGNAASPIHCAGCWAFFCSKSRM